MILFASLVSISIGHTNDKTNEPIRVLAIHSYDPEFPWTKMLRDSFAEELRTLTKDSVSIESLYFNVKKAPHTGLDQHPLKSEFLARVSSFKPSVVLLTDDFALNEMGEDLANMQMPFIFAGINGEIPEKIKRSKFKKYTGVYERYYIRDSVRLLQRLLQRKKLHLLVLLEDSEVGRIVQKYAERELKSLPLVTFKTLVTSDFSKWQTQVKDQASSFDGYFPIQPFALVDENKKHLRGEDVVTWFFEHAKRPVVFTGGWQVQCGGTLAISLRPKSQGRYAAMLMQALFNNKVLEPIIPPNGDIEINYASTERLKIKIPFDLLTTATIHKQAQIPCLP